MLQELAQWPVDNVAGALIGPGGVTETLGDTSRAFALASVTKPLVASAVLVAVEEGAVELETPAGPPGSTVAHLLSHASGLAFDSRDQIAEVGTQRIYSSAGFELLAETVEQATGIDFPDYLAAAVAEPLGMSTTTLDGPAGHGATSCVDDLARYAVDLLAPTIVAPETMLRARSVWFPGLDGFVPGYGRHKPCDWGLGFEIRDHKSPHWTAPSSAPTTFGHFGQSGTFLWVDPVREIGCVVLTDRAFGPWAKPLWSEFNESLYSR
ncbi:serine hydrolase domain-containing protein [Gordonia sp. (in: high G+C Gram-positive bacteria)]|uniref:serine hydrolase domain-containing protein n=1 Tax=Gordonia sp. (in: high G+C Gram-positive bacteria) TaxID=84139 RepID=UPI0039E3B884